LLGAAFDQHVIELGGRFQRPDRRDEPARHGDLGSIRQRIESVSLGWNSTAAAPSPACGFGSRSDCWL
jgi:hypothetical protein